MRKDNFKFYDVTAWLTNNCNTNIPRGKGNQTMKFAQLTECNMRNIFLEKSYTQCEAETRSGPFSEKLSKSLDQKSKVFHSLFLLYVKLRPIEIY